MIFTRKRIELNHSNYFDMWRGGSAIIVLIAHVFQVFAPSDQRLFSTLAGYAVMAFFAISGFFIHKSLTSYYDGEFDWRKFLHARASRILPPFVACLFLTALLWSIAPYFFSSGSHSFVTPTSRSSFSLDGLWQTAFFINGFRTPTLSANGPLWSLSFEVWYYILAGLFALIFSGKRIGYLAVPLFIALTVANKYFAIKGLVWLGGFLISMLHSNQKLPKIPRLPIWIIPFSLLSIAPLVPEAMLGKFNLLSELVFGVYMLCHMVYILKETAPPVYRPLVWSGSFSYTLYVFHFPILLFSYGISENSAILATVFALLISAAIGPPLEKILHPRRSAS